MRSLLQEFAYPYSNMSVVKTRSLLHCNDLSHKIDEKSFPKRFRNLRKVFGNKITDETIKHRQRKASITNIKIKHKTKKAHFTNINIKHKTEKARITNVTIKHKTKKVRLERKKVSLYLTIQHCISVSWHTEHVS